jgi:hypothetical protein
MMTTDEQTQAAVDTVEKDIAGEVGKTFGNANGQRAGYVPIEKRTRTAMNTVDAKAEREMRMIEALIDQAVALRVMHVRGKLAMGHNDMAARKQALDWIYSIGADTAEVVS